MSSVGLNLTIMEQLVGFRCRACGHLEICNVFFLYLPYHVMCRTGRDFDNFCALQLYNIKNLAYS